MNFSLNLEAIGRKFSVMNFCQLVTIIIKFEQLLFPGKCYRELKVKTRVWLTITFPNNEITTKSIKIQTIKKIYIYISNTQQYNQTIFYIILQEPHCLQVSFLNYFWSFKQPFDEIIDFPGLEKETISTK